MPAEMNEVQRAEANFYRVSVQNLLVERAKLEVETQYVTEQLSEARFDRARRESSAYQRRTYDFVGDVTEYEVKNAVDELNDWVGSTSEPVTVRLNSPGGSVFDGLMLYDYLQELRRSGIHVTVYCLGLAASMGSILLQGGDVRRMSANSWFMVHEPSTMALGKASAIKDEAKLMEQLHKQLAGILAARSSLTIEDIIARADRRDWWMDAHEALQYGFVDELV